MRLRLLEFRRHLRRGRPAQSRPVLQTRRSSGTRKTLIGLFLAGLALTFAAGVAEAKTPTLPPPIAPLPAAGDTAPPADAIVDSVVPITACGGWHRQSYYGGRWPTNSSWWEYSCGSCIPGCATDESFSFRYDYYVWDGSRPVYYGQWYTESYTQAEGDPCSYWWDEAASQLYGPYACTREVDAYPTASFTVSCVALLCSVDGGGSVDSDGTIASYSWGFGDGTGGSGTSAQHRYAQPGAYTATLTVTDDGGATATAGQLVAVTNAAPTAAFTVSCSGLTCNFDGSRSADSDGTIDSYRWDFGDGTSGAGKLVQHTYGQPRSYSVALTVTDDAGATAADSKTFNPISLSARGYKQGGQRKVDLSWNGVAGTSFDLYRNGGRIATVQASTYTDSLNSKGTANYVYKVCAAGTSVCSNEATVGF